MERGDSIPAFSSNSWNSLGFLPFRGENFATRRVFPGFPPFPSQPVLLGSRGNSPRQIPANSAPWECLNPTFCLDNSQLLISFCFPGGMSAFPVGIGSGRAHPLICSWIWSSQGSPYGKGKLLGAADLGEKGKNLLEFYLDLAKEESWWLKSPFPPKNFQELGWVFQVEGILWDRECGGSGLWGKIPGFSLLAASLQLHPSPSRCGIPGWIGLEASWIPGILHRLRIPG